MAGTEILVPQAETRSIVEIWRHTRYGDLDDIVRGRIIDEEMTHAAEVLAVVTRRGIIPREFVLRSGDLVDSFGQSVNEVLDFGVKDAEQSVANGKLGSEKELIRRQIEYKNFKEKILTLGIGVACVEWSPTDMTWSEEERKSQGYGGDTMVRVTCRVDAENFIQANLILQTSDLDLLNSCRALREPNARNMASAEEMLDHPQVVWCDEGDIQALVAQVEIDYINAENIGDTARTVINMFRALRNRNKKRRPGGDDAWEYLKDQRDAFDALFDSFLNSANNTPSHEWGREASIARGGLWQILIERYQGRNSHFRDNVSPSFIDKSVMNAGEISRAAERAAVSEAVFIACGDTIDMKALLGARSSSLERTAMVQVLLAAEHGVGCCSSCGRRSSLYGCGVYCRDCNEVWCEEYLLTGRQLEDREIMLQKYLRYSRGI